MVEIELPSDVIEIYHTSELLCMILLFGVGPQSNLSFRDTA